MVFLFFFLIGPLAFFIWQYQYPAKYRYALIGSLAASILLWSTINYVFKGIFLPSDPNRIELILRNQYKNENPAIKKTHNHSPKKDSREKLFVKNLTSINVNKPSFYFTFLQDRYRYLYEKPLYADTHQLLFNEFRVDSAAPGLKKYLFAEFMDTTRTRFNVKEVCNLQSAQKSKWMFVNHAIYKVYAFIVWNYIWVVVYLAIGLWLLAIVLLKPFNHTHLFILVLFLMHFVSIVVITFGHSRFQTRYPHVTEIFIPLVVLLFTYHQLKTFTKLNT